MPINDPNVFSAVAGPMGAINPRMDPQGAISAQRTGLENLRNRNMQLRALQALLGSGILGNLGSVGGGMGGDGGFDARGQFAANLPQVGTPAGPTFAPSGPNINFGGGSPFKVDTRGLDLARALALAARSIQVMKAYKPPKKKSNKGAQ